MGMRYDVHIEYLHTISVRYSLMDRAKQEQPTIQHNIFTFPSLFKVTTLASRVVWNSECEHDASSTLVSRL